MSFWCKHGFHKKGKLIRREVIANDVWDTHLCPRCNSEIPWLKKTSSVFDEEGLK